MQWVSKDREIKKLNGIFEKRKKEKAIRRLWRSCFQDPIEYEDFYFKNVYEKNTVYILKEKENTVFRQNFEKEKSDNLLGMLHLNPYSCRVEGKEQLLHYIVGVATAKEIRRQGVMRNILCKALGDMYKAGEAFTYLMPADERYYSSFGFVSVSSKDAWTVLIGEELPLHHYAEDIIYVRYQELEDYFGEDTEVLFSYIDRFLAANYSGFATHNREYFELLSLEKECENGEVVFCFEQAVGSENLLGFFAYGREEEKVFVEQNIILETAEWNVSGCEENLYVLAKQEKIQKIISGYFVLSVMENNNEKAGLKIPIEIEGIVTYPYMIRVVHVKKFLELFADCFFEFAENEIRLYVEDCLMKQSDNMNTFSSGIYYFVRETNQVTVYQEEYSKNGYDRKMTVDELVQFVFLEKGKKLFLAEIV